MTDNATPTPNPPTAQAPTATLDAIEARWIGRARRNYPNPKSKRYLDAECEFFVGAMSALEANGFGIPPRWALNLMSGRPIIDRSRITG